MIAASFIKENDKQLNWFANGVFVNQSVWAESNS